MLPILNQSFWRDEAFSVILASKSPWDIISLTIQDTNPPLYYMLLHFWMLLFGHNEAAVRGLSFFFHVLTLPVVYLITRHFITSTRVRLMILTAVLLNPFLLQYAFEARAYSLMVLLASLAVWQILEKRYISASVWLSLGVLTHNFGIFNLAAVGVWWLWLHQDQVLKSEFKTSFKLFLIPALTMLGWGTIIWDQWAKVAGGFWIKQPTTSVWLSSFQKYSSGDLGYSVQSNLHLLSLILVFFALSYWIWNTVKDTNKTVFGLLASMTFVPTAITFVVSNLFAPLYLERYLISAIPFAIIMIGYSLWQLFIINKAMRNVMIGLLSVYFALVMIASEQITGTTTKTPINYGVSQILKQAQPGDVIVPESILNFLETTWYVQTQGSSLPVYAYSEDGKIPFYVGGVLYEQPDIIRQLPTGTRVWHIKPDASTQLITPNS